MSASHLLAAGKLPRHAAIMLGAPAAVTSKMKTKALPHLTSITRQVRYYISHELQKKSIEKDELDRASRTM
jgi:hypothetical protein